MTAFWLATFAIDAATDDSVVGPIVNARTPHVAIEVLRDGEDWAVLFSSVKDPKQPESLTCLIGFSNVAKACNVWLDRGFPLVDAVIREDEAGLLSIVSPFFISDQLLMNYETPLLALSGITFSPTGPDQQSSAPGTLTASYDQHLQAPDGAQPDVFITKKPVKWSPRRSNVRKLSPQSVSSIVLDLGASPSRCPSLAPLTTGRMKPTAVWSGEIQLPDKEHRVLGHGGKPQKVAHLFGVPAFRFEDVEALGFRINLAELGRDVQDNLAKLVEPLNFHLSEPTAGRAGDNRHTAVPDFRYRAATTTLVIELLRYGRMKARVPMPPLGIDDSQSQHELVVRLLVGRVDDDSAQAHAPAVFVPAIFVDNPWSKVLGRDAIGFDKRMADFCVLGDNGRERLLPDGRLTRPGASGSTGEQGPEPLGDIRHVNLVERTGVGFGPSLLDLDFSSNDHTDPDALQPIDLDLAFGTSILAGTRWRQSDFDEVEFRRSFANVAVAESVRAFRSIQVAPVADRGGLGHAWITGTFAIDDNVRVALPTGNATLTLHAIPRDEKRPAASSTPSSWNLLCEMLGDRDTARITLSSGSWYRLSCSMDLTIDDGLDWRTLGA